MPVVGGVVVLVVADGSGAPLEFGWTSYRPLESEFGYRSEPTLGLSDRWTVLWSGVHLLAAALMVLGLLLLVAVGGWLLGRRSAAAG